MATQLLLNWTLLQIRRPYFHVKPLEKGQLKNWKEYLDFEIENGSHERVMVLFERCMIACALYEEFWLKVSNSLLKNTKYYLWEILTLTNCFGNTLVVYWICFFVRTERSIGNLIWYTGWSVRISFRTEVSMSVRTLHTVYYVSQPNKPACLFTRTNYVC